MGELKCQNKLHQEAGPALAELGLLILHLLFSHTIIKETKPVLFAFLVIISGE
jgi:hypothetical protein